MDILLSETEQNLLMLLEELAKHQDSIKKKRHPITV